MNRKLSIGFVTRGLTKYRAPLYAKLAARNNLDFTVYFQHFDRSAHLVGFSEPRDLDFPYLRPFKVGKSGWFLFRATGRSMPHWGQARAVCQAQHDVLVLEALSNAGTDGLLLPWLRRTRTAYIWWGLGKIPQRQDTVQSRIGDRFQAIFLRNASAALAYCTYSHEHHVRLGLPVERSFVVYNTLDEQAILSQIPAHLDQAQWLRRDWNLDGGPVLLFSGTINAGKKLDVLLLALSALRQGSSPTFKLIVMGDGPDMARCQALAHQLQLDECVIWVGRKEETEATAYFLASDVVVIPGLGGLAINHAFAHSRPVICGPADGCERDLVKPGVTGWLMPASNERILTDTLKTALAERNQWEVMGKQAQDLISKQVTLNRFAATIELAAYRAANRPPPQSTREDAHLPPVPLA